jgi:hypothetical protein
MPRARQRSTAKIAPPSIAQLTSTLDALPEKPKESYSLRETVSQLYEPISSALSRGYNYEEIAALLAKHGIEISVFSLKRYLSLSKSEQTQRSEPEESKPRRGRKPKQAAEATEETEETPEASEVQPEPAPKRRGRAKAAAAEPEVTTPVDAPAEAPSEPAPKRRGRTSKAAAKTKPAARATSRTGTGRGRKKATS